jgi:hypothetical protein
MRGRRAAAAITGRLAGRSAACDGEAMHHSVRRMAESPEILLLGSERRSLRQLQRYGVPHHEVDTSSCWKPLAIRVWDRAS